MGENPGTRVRVEGLNHDVMDNDIKELFSGVGDLLHCAVCLRRCIALCAEKSRL